MSESEDNIQIKLTKGGRVKEIHIPQQNRLPRPVPRPEPAPVPPAPISTPSIPALVPVAVAPTEECPNVIIAAYPTVVNPDGTLADEQPAIENKGGAVVLSAGHSKDIGETFTTIAYGSFMSLHSGTTTPGFDESGGGGEVLIDSGGVEIWGQPEGDFNGLTYVGRGATILMGRGSVDPNHSLDYGGSIILTAGEVYRAYDPGSTSGGRVSIYGAQGHQPGSVRIDSGGVSQHGLEITATSVEVIGDTFGIGQPWQCPGAQDPSGNQGNIRWDSEFIYLKTTYNEWKRVPLKSFAQEIENFGDEFRMGDAFIRFVHEENGFPIQNPRIQIGVGDSVAMEFRTGDDPYVQGFETPVRVNSPFGRFTGTYTVSSHDAPGANGTFCFDENYMYYCYADNQWGRVALERNW